MKFISEIPQQHESNIERDFTLMVALFLVITYVVRVFLVREILEVSILNLMPLKTSRVSRGKPEIS